MRSIPCTLYNFYGQLILSNYYVLQTLEKFRQHQLNTFISMILSLVSFVPYTKSLPFYSLRNKKENNFVWLFILFLRPL